jgi:hypothetical protein
MVPPRAAGRASRTTERREARAILLRARAPPLRKRRQPFLRSPALNAGYFRVRPATEAPCREKFRPRPSRVGFQPASLCGRRYPRSCLEPAPRQCRLRTNHRGRHPREPTPIADAASQPPALEDDRHGPAVDAPRGTGDVARTVGAQERDHSRNLLRLCKPAKRPPRSDFRQHLVALTLLVG